MHTAWCTLRTNCTLAFCQLVPHKSQQTVFVGRVSSWVLMFIYRNVMVSACPTGVRQSSYWTEWCLNIDIHECDLIRICSCSAAGGRCELGVGPGLGVCRTCRSHRSQFDTVSFVPRLMFQSFFSWYFYVSLIWFCRRRWPMVMFLWRNRLLNYQ